MSLKPHLKPSRAVRNAALAILVVHTATALWVWSSWGQFGRGTALVWLDFPVALTYLDLPDPQFLAASLIAGGLQWAGLAALLTYLVGRSARPRAPLQ